MPLERSQSFNRSSEEELHELVDDARAHRREIDDVRGQLHVPNHIPSKTRWKYLLQSFLLLIYGTFCVVIDDFYIPGKRGGGAHFQGVPALLLYGVVLAASASMFSVVLDHYDERANERSYRRFAFWSQVAAWALGVGALALSIYIG